MYQYANFYSLIKYFGRHLESKTFQAYLTEHFNDLTEYNILDCDYISSIMKGIELGFTNDTAVFDDTQMLFEKGFPIFSHFNLFPISSNFLTDFPFIASFQTSRDEIHRITGLPTTTRATQYLNLCC